MPPDVARTREAEAAYPTALRDREEELLARRPGRAANRGRIGVALSGGGIRSATFALGVFQGWARAGFLKEIDFLSTVSGGGYFGSFVGRLYSRSYITGPADVAWVLGGPEPAASAGHTPEQRELLAKARSEVLPWLRENGRYLSPRGAGDLLVAGAALLRNWISMQVVIGLLLFSVSLLIQMPDIAIDQGLTPPAWMIDAAARLVPTSALSLWWSGWFVVPVAVAMLCLPVIWAYWLVSDDKSTWWAFGAASIVAVFGATAGTGPLRLLGIGLIGVAIGAVIVLVAALARSPQGLSLRALLRPDLATQSSLRNRLTAYMKSLLVVAGVLAVLAFVDTLGQTIYDLVERKALGTWVGAVAAAVVSLAAAARQLAVLLGRGADGARLRLPASVPAMAGGLLLVLVITTGYSLFAHAVVWDFDVPRIGSRIGWAPYLAWLFCSLLLAWAVGRSLKFVNQSSHQPLYGARLTRAYLGASNPKRWSGAKSKPVTEPMPDDDLGMAEYWAPPAPGDIYSKGVPLHLVNVTINETFGGRSQVQQQDRKGLGLAVGPAGLSAGMHSHLVFDTQPVVPETGAEQRTFVDHEAAPTPVETFRVFEYGQVPGVPQRLQAESLSLGRWVGVSGAAFTTGLGAKTNLGLSLLTGLTNVRLGHWWHANVDMTRREHSAVQGRWLGRVGGQTFEFLFRAQKLLVAELVARFPGVARPFWYLSDGGHFENMGGYELVRRRLDVVIIVDAEQDADYSFGGLANLVRKARLDFGARITFLDDDEARPREGKPGVLPTLRGLGLPPELFGSLNRLRPVASSEAGTAYSRAHAALAVVTYEDEERAGSAKDRWLLYVKSTLTGDEPDDVLQYGRSHAAFPHETTADQFFDEAQWESYRRLGEHVATRVFSAIDPVRAASMTAGDAEPGRFGA